MTQTFISRISNLKQYDDTTKTIIWEDPSKNRWGSSGVYSRINHGDNVIFITDKKQKKAVLIGKVKSIEEKKGITCGYILELACTNDQLLGIAAMLPEKISQTKANFPSLIHPETLNIEEIIKDIINKNFVAFHIVTISKYSDIKSSFKPNDRIVIINKENAVENARIYNPEKNITEQEEIPLNVTGLTLNQILDINRKEKNNNERSNNIRRIRNIINRISSEGHYKFNGFWGFYDALINKKTYSNANITDDEQGKVEDEINSQKKNGLDEKENNLPEGKPKQTVSNGKKIYTTNPKNKARAIINSNFTCELNSSHKTFLSQKTKNEYLEGHHFIPMSEQKNYKYSIDVAENIIALCPNCHRMLHHGCIENKKEYLSILYNKRKGLLKKKGIDITLDQLLNLYK